MNSTVSILAEVPEALHKSLIDYLEAYPDWSQDRVFTAALSLFLSTQQAIAKRKRQEWVIICTDEAGQEHYGSIGDRASLQFEIEIAQGFLPGRQFRLEPLPIKSLIAKDGEQ